MPSRYQICCIRRSDRLNHDRRIRMVGGVNLDGSRWQISEETVIAGIETGQWHFFVWRGGRQIDIVVATSRYGAKYIKAADDAGPQPEGLLALPDCR